MTTATAVQTTPPARYRPLTFGVTRVQMRDGAGAHVGVHYMRADQPLQDYAPRITDRLVHWAQTSPTRTFMARRQTGADGTLGDWRHLSYAQAWTSARRIAQALLDRGLSAERPVAILSENGLEHAQLALGCLLAGVPYCSVSPPYSLVSQDFDKLLHVIRVLTPGLVFAADAKRYGRALQAITAHEAGAQVECVLAENATDFVASSALFKGVVSTFSSMLATADTPAVDAAMARVGPDTIAKFLFTSGSTKLPKAVINTHRMWCANQQQMRQSMPVLADERDPPVLVDWLPWNHTFGGNHNFGLTLYNGGTLYIDDGKPTPALMGETLRNLREISPTVYFNVPTGFEAIALAMQGTGAEAHALRSTLLKRVKMFFYAGAALAQPVWDSLHRSQEAEVGERIVMGTGLGMTESGPFAIFVTNPHVRAGDLGVPTPGMDLKLVPVDGKTEVRYKGPNITPGYWRAPQATAEAFDDEGFFCSGDAVLWIDPTDVHQGLKFDGRIAEDFKLATGTFVSVGPLRARVIAAGAPYVQDVVLTGLNRREVGALVFPTPKVRSLAGMDDAAPLADVLAAAPVQAHFQHVLNTLAAQATGSANRIARLHVLAQPPSIDRGEVTDKGSINQRAVLQHRAALVQAFDDDQWPLTAPSAPELRVFFAPRELQPTETKP
jgi:feruloyl-CoA synthase